MKKRVLALVCCLSLTLGLFTYRPPEAKAIVTEASLATSVLWSFMQSAGITFNGTGMNSSSWAEAIEPYLRDFTEATDSAAKSFWHWLGYDGASEFIKALSWSKITHPDTMPFPSVVIPPAVAKKMGEFTHWFAEKVGLTADSKPITVSGSNIKATVMAGAYRCFSENKDMSNYDRIVNHKTVLAFYSPLGSFGTKSDVYGLIYSDFEPVSPVLHLFSDNTRFEGVNYSSGFYLDNRNSHYFDAVVFPSDFSGRGFVNIAIGFRKVCDYSPDILMSDQSSFVTAVQSGALSPTYDDKGEKSTVVAYPNINGDLSSINDLLQQILDKLAANDLNSSASLEGETAPDVPATDIGWKGTIEKIYQGIIDLPGRIADAFKTLLESLFAPDAALMQEMTDTFKGKFSFLTTLHKVGTDLFGMTADSEPPVIWVHLEDAEGKYTYGGPVKALDLSWYQRYKADVDKLISGFLWLAFLWLLFKRAASIIHGGEMYTEYASDIRDYYRSGKKDDGPTVPVNRRLGE